MPGTADTTAIEARLAASRDEIIERLRDYVAIPSVSTDPAYKLGIEQAASFVAERLRQAGLTDVAIRPTAGHPVVTASWRGAPGKPTVLVYGHYDVQPPDPIDMWKSPPFEASIRDNRLYARGAADDKGPMLIPIEVVAAYMAQEGGCRSTWSSCSRARRRWAARISSRSSPRNTELLEMRFRALGGWRAVAGGPAERHRRQPRHLRAGSHGDGRRQGPAFRPPRRGGGEPDPGAGRAARRPA